MNDRIRLPAEGLAMPIPDSTMTMSDRTVHMDGHTSILNRANERRDAVLKALEVISCDPFGTKRSKVGHGSADKQWRLL